MGFMRPEGSSRQQLADFVVALIREGRPRAKIAEAIRRRYNVNARVSFRLMHGWSQREVADRWNERWPSEPKTAKNISYWEQWPSKTGYAPSLDVLDRLAQLYGCRVADLLADGRDYQSTEGASVSPSPTTDQAGQRLRSEAERTTAAQAAGRAADGEGWYVTLCKALLRLDIEPPEAIDERWVMSTTDGLRELDTAVSVPRHRDDTAESHGLVVDLIYGGRLERREHPHESFFQHIVALAEPLQAGQEHSYAMKLQLPPGQPLAPHFVQVPLRRIDQFDVRVRFSMDRMPRVVWQLAEVAPAVVFDPKPADDRLRVDRFGEVHATFRFLRQGFAYGIRWEY